MLTLDTSGILAAVNDADPHHAQAVSALHLDRGPFIIPTGILAEVAYMLEARLGTAVLDAFLADVQERAFILHCGEEDLPRIRALITRYENLPLGYADAAVIACAEHGGGRVLSYDLRHFPVVVREGTITVIGSEPL